MIAYIKTARLEIKPFAAEDRERLSSLLLNDDIKKTYMIPDFATSEQLEKMMDNFERLSRDEGRFLRGVYDADGLVGFVNDVEMVNRYAGGYIELGYVIHPECWGRGYATEMLGAVIGAMVSEGFATVRTGAFSENPASMRVMEKCGMQRIELTEEIEYRGQNHHCIYYEIAL